MEARLATGIWVAALRQRLEAGAVPFYILARGDATAGAVALIAVAGPDAALWQREYDLETGTRVWRITAQGPAADIATAARRQRGFDPDLWLIEVEVADLAPWLDGLD